MVEILKNVRKTDMKHFAKDLKTISYRRSERKPAERVETGTKKMVIYPSCMNAGLITGMPSPHLKISRMSSTAFLLRIAIESWHYVVD